MLPPESKKSGWRQQQTNASRFSFDGTAFTLFTYGRKRQDTVVAHGAGEAQKITSASLMKFDRGVAMMSVFGFNITASCPECPSAVQATARQRSSDSAASQREVAEKSRSALETTGSAAAKGACSPHG